MCRGWIVFCCLLAAVCTDIGLGVGACSISSGQNVKQCGDDFFDASLCLKCGCCITGQDQGPSEINSTSCYIPPGSENTYRLSRNCTRSLKSLLGQVLLLNDGPAQPHAPITFYVLLERYSPLLQTSLTAFGASEIAPALRPFSTDAKDLPSPVKKQFEDLKSGAGPFFFSYTTVTYPLPDIYSAALLIQSQDGLDSVTIESNVSVTRTNGTRNRLLAAAALLQSAVLVNEGPYNVGEESTLAVVLDDLGEDIELTLDFGDDSSIARRGSMSFRLGAFPAKPGYACLFHHRYSSGGEYVVKAILNNPNAQFGISLVRMATTVRIKCSFPRVEITGGSASRSGAMQKKRNEAMAFQARVIQDCTDQPVVTEWSLFLIDRDKDTPKYLVSTSRSWTNELEVKFQPFTLAYGLHVLNITGIIPYHNQQKQLIVTEAAWFEVVASRPIAVIDGPLLAGDWENVTFNASKSYDPDANGLVSSSLIYTWYCLTGQWNMTMLQNQVETEFKNFEGCHYPGCRCEQPLAAFSENSFLITWPHDVHYRQTIPAIYSIALHLLAFNSRSAYALQSVMFYSDKSNATLTSQAAPSPIPNPLVDKIPDVDIACLSNCLEHVDHTKPLVLYAHCRNCILHEQLTYEWDFQSANDSFTLKKIDWARDTLTGNQKASLIVNAKTFENIIEDESYQFFVTVTRLNGKYIKVGFSCYFAKYNTDYSIGASKDNSPIAMQLQLHLFLVVLFVLSFDWM